MENSQLPPLPEDGNIENIKPDEMLYTAEQMREYALAALAAAAPAAVYPDVVGSFEEWWNGRGMPEGLKPAFYMAWKAALNVE